MTTGKKIPGSMPSWIAAACFVFLVAVLAISLLSRGTVPASGSPRGTTGLVQAGPALPSTCPPGLVEARITPVEPELLNSSTLALNRPPADDRIPYTARGFDQQTEAAVAWWMSPGFMDNTTEFQGYERKPAEGKLAYPQEHRIFFDFIQDELDAAERESVLNHHHLLFRGISPSVAGVVMNTSRYHEPAFASTSYDISFSLDSFGVRSPDGYRNILVLERESGDHALYINEDEREYLLPRGSDWIVTRTANVENLTVTADFPLKDRSTGTAFFDHVRLISVRPAACL